MMKVDDNEYYQMLNKAFMESSAQFNKEVLYFSSGALGLSFAFIKDIVKLDVAENKYLLIISWSLFGSVILLSVISHYTSLKALNKKMLNLNAQKDKVSTKLNGITKRLNIIMIVLLATGLLFLTVFISINI